MIFFIIGEPKSGKSEYVEQLLFKQHVLYVGTLLSDPDYETIIAAHRVRRPAYWGLYECSGDIRRDVEGVLVQKNEYDAILIDGLTYYIRQAVYLRTIPEYTVIRRVLSFLKAFATGNTDLYLVDHFFVNNGRLEADFIRFYHDLVCRYSDRILQYANGELSEWNGINNV